MDRFEELAQRHAAWSHDTFGSDLDRDWTGPLAHLRREISEVEENPFDRYEWADCLLLLLDASRRAGFNASGILMAAEAKLMINERRDWDKPNHDGSIEHVRDTE